MSCGFFHASVNAVDGNSDNYGAESDDGKVDLYLAHLKCFRYLFGYEEIVEGEVHSEHDHEDGNYPLKVRCIRCKAVSLYAETTCTCRTECGADTVKERHSADEENDDLSNCKRQIDEIEHLCSRSYSRNDLTYCRAGALCTHKVHVGAARHRNDSKKENEYAHAANPVCQ